MIEGYCFLSVSNVRWPRRGLAQLLDQQSLLWQFSPEDTTSLASVILSQAVDAHVTTLFRFVDAEINIRLRIKNELHEDESFWTMFSHGCLHYGLYADRIYLYAQSMTAQIAKIYPGDDEASLSFKNQLSRLSFRTSEFKLRCDMVRKVAVSNLDAQRNQSNNTGAIGVTRLTILAAIFLPASLSSSLLAMSTRFKDLNLLLYDFVGVFFLLGAMALFGYGSVILGTRSVASYRKYFKRVSSSNLEKLVPFLLFVVTPAVMTTAAFLTGMLWDARNGGIALGVGVALYVILLVVTFVLRSIWPITFRSIS